MHRGPSLRGQDKGAWKVRIVHLLDCQVGGCVLVQDQAMQYLECSRTEDKRNDLVLTYILNCLSDSERDLWLMESTALPHRNR